MAVAVETKQVETVSVAGIGKFLARARRSLCEKEWNESARDGLSFFYDKSHWMQGEPKGWGYCRDPHDRVYAPLQEWVWWNDRLVWGMQGWPVEVPTDKELAGQVEAFLKKMLAMPQELPIRGPHLYQDPESRWWYKLHITPCSCAEPGKPDLRSFQGVEEVLDRSGVLYRAFVQGGISQFDPRCEGVGFQFVD